MQTYPDSDVLLPQGTKVDLPGLAAYFEKQEEVVLAYLFGSTATGRANLMSDVDIAVLLDPAPEGEALIERQLEYMAGVEPFTNRQVQVVLLNHAPPLLAHEIVRSGRRIHRRSQVEQISYEVRVRKLYLDTKPMLDFHHKAVLKAIQEVGLGNRRRRGRTSDAAG